MRTRILILACLLTIVTATADAATRIDGRVVDTTTGAPVLAANVIVVGTNDGSATDAGGHFKFVTSQSFPVELHVSHIAYEDLKFTLYNDSTLIIELIPAILEGKIIIITGKRFQPGPGVSSVVETITSQAIEKLGARDIGDVLRPLASVTIQATNSGKQYISIRGGNPNEVAVFLDGIRINDANTGVADLSAIDLSDMQKVEVIKGGSSILAGNGAFGGVIQLTSQLPDSNRANFIRSIGYTDNFDQDLTYSASIRFGAIGIGGNHSSKSRQYDGNSIYTTVFNSTAAVLYFRPGNFSFKQYDLEKFIDLNDGLVVQSDVTNLSHIRYHGSILSSNEWDLFFGRRGWSWTDNYFASVTREFSEESYSGKIVHELSNHLGSATLQYDQESQAYTADHSFTPNFVQGVVEHTDVNRLRRDSQGFAAVLRADSESGADYLELLRWEASIRVNRLTTTHRLSTIQDDPVTHNRATERMLLDQTDYEFDINQKYGVRLEGSSQRMDYGLFYNQGHNTRPPSLNDYTLWAISNTSLDEALPLRSESVATTEIGLELIVRPERYANIDMEVSLNTGIYYNVYDNKIAYEYFDAAPPIPYNILDTRIHGFEINANIAIFDRKMYGRIGYRNLGLNDPRVYPNTPGYRFSSQLELNYPWLMIQLDGYFDGPQFVIRNGHRSTQKLTRYSVNLNILYRWYLERVTISLAYSVKNLLRANGSSGETFDGVPFAYYDQHRQIITVRIRI